MVVPTGSDVTLNCSAPCPLCHIQWWEWVSSPINVPLLISDRELVAPVSNYARYSIVQSGNSSFNLLIHSVQLSDAGTFTCFDPAVDPCGIGNVGTSFELIVVGEQSYNLKYNIIILLFIIIFAITHNKC